MAGSEDRIAVIGESNAFLEVMERVSLAAPLSKPVLVIGERGTGKELIGARLHYLSERWELPFVKFNCAALNEELLESELFGHVAGAYTGATRGRAGRFELADGGSVFLDELSSMSMRLQEKLLRVVEYGEYERVGSSETRTTDVRFIGAANLDLPDLARQGRFREDLLDRLSFDVITLPPLRERIDDIPLLAQQFGQDMARELDHEYFPGFAPAAERQLLEYGWPGNVRQLRNAVERAVYRNPQPKRPIEQLEIDPFESPWRPRGLHTVTSPTGPAGRVEHHVADDVPENGDAEPAMRDPASGLPDLPLDMKQAVESFEVRLLDQALADARYNQRRAAELLGLTYHQLRGMLRKYELLDRS